MKLKVKKLTKDAILPRKAHESDAAFDVFVPFDMMLYTGRNVIPLNIAIELPHYHVATIKSRSGFASKGMEVYDEEMSVRIDADVIDGVIDSGYRGNVSVIINNRSGCKYLLKAGTRIAQMVIQETAHIDECEEVDELSDGERMNNGFGSTGV